MRKLCLFILSFLLVSPLFAQDRLLECAGDVPLTEANALIDKVQSKYSEVKAIKANFTQSSYLAAVDAGEDSSGEVWLEKPSKMKWQYKEPEEQTFLMNDETLWLYQPLDNQVVIQRVEDVLLTDLPVAFLMGMGDLKKDFKLNKACKAANGTVLQMLPAKADKGNELEGFTMLVDTVTSFPRTVQIVHVGGNKTTITLENTDFKPEIADNTFKAEFPKGIDINDMRK